jgi:hypothetical protein
VSAKELALVALDELPQDGARGGELRVQQRAPFLVRGEQDELPVEARMVEVAVVPQLVADLGREARDVDNENPRAWSPCP